MALLGERSWYLPGWLDWLPGRQIHDTDVSKLARPTLRLPG